MHFSALDALFGAKVEMLLAEPRARVLEPDVTSSEPDFDLKAQPSSGLWSKEMDNLQIPRFLQESYLQGNPAPAIHTLRQWQIDLFEMTQWRERKNCLVLVPTASGKTVAAEVAIAQTLNRNPSAKAIYCVPFVSLAAEKHAEFTARFQSFSVRPYYANYGSYEFRTGSIAVATFEKAHALINTAVKNRYDEQIELVVIDEIHMIGEEHRGATVEALVAKLRMLAHQPRIIGLSATICPEDSEVFGRWMGGFVFRRTDRPSEIVQYVKLLDGSLCKIENGALKEKESQLRSIDQDKNHFLPLIANALEESPENSILVFVSSRKDARLTAEFIANNLHSREFELIRKAPYPSLKVVNARKEVVQTITSLRGSTDMTMNTCIMRGVAFHHAGLLLEERKVIEKALRDGTLNVVVATTTLSAGINISNVSMVIIHSIFRTEAGGKTTPMTAAQYNQMAGRAGRKAGQPGTVVMIERSKKLEEANLMLSLSHRSIERLNGHLLDDQEFDKYYLQSLYCMKSQQYRQLPMLAFETFANKRLESDLAKVKNEAIIRLKNQRLIISEDRITKLGSAIAGANFGVIEGLTVYENLNVLRQTTCFADDLYFLYLCIPTDIGFRTPAYKHPMWQKLYTRHEMAINTLLQVTTEDIDRLFTQCYINGGFKCNNVLDEKMDKVFASAILMALIDEQALEDVEKVFGIDRGTVQALQTNAVTFAGQVVKLCELSGFGVLGAAINRFKHRLEVAVKNELLELTTIPSCAKTTARLLFNQGIETVVDVIACSVKDLAVILSHGKDNEISDDAMHLAAKLINEAEMVMRFRDQAQALAEDHGIVQF